MLELSHSNSNLPKNPISKLHQYFASSSYLSQQDEIRIFIQDFPKIDLNEVKSINQLLPVIIKQNKLLADKCQQQVNLLKQSFMKHESLIKNNRDMKKQLQMMIQEFKLKRSEVQNEQIFIKRENQAINERLKLSQLMNNMQNQIFGHFVQGNYKKCEEFVNLRQTRLTFQDYGTERLKINTNSEFVPVPLQMIEKFCKQQRKVIKYYGKVKSSVEQFCGRLNKIVYVVDQKLLAKEFQQQTQNFLAIIDQLIQSSKTSKKRKNQRSLSTNPHMSSSSMIHVNQPNYNFFEDLLKRIKLSKDQSNNQQAEQISEQIQQLKSQLQESRQYYENYLINIKLQYEKETRIMQEELTVKIQMNKHYEEQLQKFNNQREDLLTKADYLTKQNECWMKDKQKFVDQIQYLSSKISKFQDQKKQLEQFYLKKSKQQEQLKDLKINHLNQLKEEQIKHRKQKQQESNQELQKLKKKIKDLSQQKNEIQEQKITIKRGAQQLSETITHLKSKLSQFQSMVRSLQQKTNSIQATLTNSKKQNESLIRQIKQLQQETNLQTSYIKQLQAKLSNKQQKLKSLTTKLSSQSISKKQVSGIKSAFSQIQRQNGQLNLQYRKQKQDNGRLKLIIKQMKKQLEDVFMTVHNLKQLQQDRERLVLQAQQSQRWKEQIMKDYDEMKYQILRVETENNNLLLENKHYKNSLKRIEAFK